MDATFDSVNPLANLDTLRAGLLAMKAMLAPDAAGDSGLDDTGRLDADTMRLLREAHGS